jgi:hypothetical protein
MSKKIWLSGILVLNMGMNANGDKLKMKSILKRSKAKASRDPTGGGPQLGSRARMQGGHVCDRHVPDIRSRRRASSYGSQQPCAHVLGER